MNVYKIRISCEKTDAPARRRTVGYATGGNEYEALKAIGFWKLVLQKYIEESGTGIWQYKAENATGCTLYVERFV